VRFYQLQRVYTEIFYHARVDREIFYHVRNHTEIFYHARVYTVIFYNHLSDAKRRFYPSTQQQLLYLKRCKNTRLGLTEL